MYLHRELGAYLYLEHNISPPRFRTSTEKPTCKQPRVCRHLLHVSIHFRIGLSLDEIPLFASAAESKKSFRHLTKNFVDLSCGNLWHPIGDCRVQL